MASSLIPSPPPMSPNASSNPIGDGNLQATTMEPSSLMPPPPPTPLSKASTKSTGDVTSAVTVREPSFLMPPPPPMSPKASARLTADGNLSATVREAPSIGDGVPSTGSTPGETLESFQAAGDADKKKSEIQGKGSRNEGAHAQARFNSGIYSIPSWSAAPAFPFTLEVIKDGALVDTLDVSSKGAYMFGRSDQCDFTMEHPSISRFHAVLQFKRTGDAFIHDLGSTHGTIVNKKKVPGKTYVELHVGDLFKFGLSSRLYVLQGPSELMPKVGLTKAEKQLLRESQVIFDMADQEASLLRAKREAAQIEGATWGMMEDAIESEIQEEEEITWQNYKGQLTEKQQKTLEKIHKRNEKVSSLKREIDAIQVKEIPQGGLTQGQQTQVARNQQRIEQLMEELDNLEETLNQSIHESMGARGEKRAFKKGLEDEEEDLSDEDDFYDRTTSSRKGKGNDKGNESGPVVETADTLLEKRDIILKELERLEKILAVERKDDDDGTASAPESQDPLDAFMTTVSSKLESEHALNLRKEIEKQQADLNRVAYLLKVADPSGEALTSWEKGKQSNKSAAVGAKQTVEQLPKTGSSPKVTQTESKRKENAVENSKNKGATSVAKLSVDEEQLKGKLENSKGPLWLGHARNCVDESKINSGSLHETISNDEEFVEYKERHKSTIKTEDHVSSSAIPEDACGLIVRKRKEDGKGSLDAEESEDEKRLWEGAALAAADTVALLLRHQKGLGAFVDEELQDEMPHTTTNEGVLSSGSKKRKLGPERPDFLKKEEGKFQAWVPPSGQTGDGKTKLNEKYGY